MAFLLPLNKATNTPQFPLYLGGHFFYCGFGVICQFTETFPLRTDSHRDQDVCKLDFTEEVTQTRLSNPVNYKIQPHLPSIKH
jgi:hypothetical protein